MLCVT
ncbi:hypothetical protein CP09DC78_1209A, partial [Chlamydia psittaci 09DC78]